MNIPFDDTKLSSDDVLSGVSQWQETNDADGSWALSLEEETKGQRLAAENRAKCNNLTKEERERLRKKGLNIIYGKMDKQSVPSPSDANQVINNNFWNLINYDK